MRSGGATAETHTCSETYHRIIIRPEGCTWNYSGNIHIQSIMKYLPTGLRIFETIGHMIGRELEALTPIATNHPPEIGSGLRTWHWHYEGINYTTGNWEGENTVGGKYNIMMVWIDWEHQSLLVAGSWPYGQLRRELTMSDYEGWLWSIAGAGERYWGLATEWLRETLINYCSWSTIVGALEVGSTTRRWESFFMSWIKASRSRGVSLLLVSMYSPARTRKLAIGYIAGPLDQITMEKPSISFNESFKRWSLDGDT